LKVEVVPWPVALAWHGLVILLLTLGAVGILGPSQGAQTQVLLGWLAVALVAVGQMLSLELTMMGFIVFGAAAVMGRRLPLWGGALLTLGALGFLATTLINGPFWGEPNPSPSVVPRFAFGLSLLLIALGWIVLGLLRRTERVIL